MKKVAEQRDAFVAAAEAAEKAVERQLQAGADEADAAYEVFKALRQMLPEYKRANPLDPRVEEWEEFLEAWAEQMPKEPEE